MKKINIIKGIAALSVLMMGFASCEQVDYPDRFHLTSGKPVIDYIRYANKDILIDQAYMDETICVVGQNLTSVAGIRFNDQPAVLNTSYITDKTLLVAVPKNQATEITDKIYFLTKDGETVDYAFHVMPPSPIVNAMDCEYAHPGTVAHIYGDYFIDLEYVEFQGVDARVDVSELSYTENDITLTIPAGATPGMVKVKTNSGLSGSIFQYQDQRGLLFDFDGKTGLYAPDNRGWHAQVVTSDATSISGNFLQLGDGATEMKGDGSVWADGVFSFEYWPGAWQNPEPFTASFGRKLSAFADFSDFANMAYKFEMYIPEENPWTGGALQILPAAITVVSNGEAGAKDTEGNVLGGCNNKYIGDNGSKYPRALYTPWANGLTHTGGKWITVTIPMNTILYQADGKLTEGDPVSASSFDSLVLFLNGSGGLTGADCKPILKIDNIRAVPIK